MQLHDTLLYTFVVYTCSIAVNYTQFHLNDAYIDLTCNCLNQRVTYCILLWSFVGLVVMMLLNIQVDDAGERLSS